MTNLLRTIALALLVVAVWPNAFVRAADKPHIVYVLADDLGWKNVGWHESENKTPNLDKLAKGGVRLERFYVMPLCTPTRSSLMTGRYPMRMGLQSGVIRPWAQYGMPLEERTLPQALKEAGYATAIVGKWHLGNHERAYLPTKRGFDLQYGHYCGMIDYNTHIRDGGLDWHRQDKGLREEGYSTELLGKEAVRVIEKHDAAKPLFLYVPFNAPHSPLQAPKKYLDKYVHVKDEKRRIYAAMVDCMDEQVGNIRAALEKKKMMKDTLLIFSSDNGGPIPWGADNGSLRGGKGGLYEGGVRVPAFAHWQGKLKPGICNEPLHAVDWYPTLLKLAGVSLKQKLPLDGKDSWPTIAQGKPSPHEEIVYNVEPHAGALRRGDWKLIARCTLPLGKKGEKDKIELYNLADDPNEKTDLAAKNPKKVAELLARLDAHAKAAVPPNPGAFGGKPKNFKTPKVWGEKD